MGIHRAFEPSRLVIAILVSREYRDGEALDGLVALLESRFGEVDYRGEVFDFRWTDYYDGEMGEGIGRLFVSFARLVDPAELASIKIWTNELERSRALGGARRFNLDPGLLGLGSLILATTKNRAHRVPLSLGIYAELTLYYEGGDFRALPWTYADWRSDEYRSLLRELRARLKIQLASEARSR